MNYGDRRLPDRFWDKVHPCPISGCWLWFGATTSRGYGSYNVGANRRGKQITTPAHKAAWRAGGGRVPRYVRVRAVLDHRCRVRCCVNPWHLRILREPVNVLIGDGPSARNAAKTHCPHGHAYDEANTYRLRRGNTIKRYCRACRRKTVAIPPAPDLTARCGSL